MGMIGMSDKVVMKLELGLIPYISCCRRPERKSLPNNANLRVKQIIDSEQRRRTLSSFPSAHEKSSGQ
jgi:hypothetical protein